MTAILYPVARTAEEALEQPLGRAARAKEASGLADGPVRFTSEEIGPAFDSREAALDAFVGRLDDDRPGHVRELAPEDRFLVLRERLAASAAGPVEPVNTDGHRWPKAPPRGKPTFRVSVSYWRVGEAEAGDPGQARDVRRKAEAASLDPGRLRALAQQPLRPVRPQQPLDIGLFEAPAPEAPHILIPDE